VNQSAGPSLHVSVDRDFCAASGVCTGIAPKVFDLPADSDVAVVISDPVTDLEQIALVEEAEQSCPTAAISLERA
jgi:ferredoxin